MNKIKCLFTMNKMNAKKKEKKITQEDSKIIKRNHEEYKKNNKKNSRGSTHQAKTSSAVALPRPQQALLWRKGNYCILLLSRELLCIVIKGN